MNSLVGIVVFGYIGIVMALAIVSMLLKKDKPIRMVVPRTEFERLGEQAIRYQRMKSFITETELDEFEVINGDCNKKNA